MKVVVSGGVLMEIVHGGLALEGRSLSCEIKRNKRYGKDRSERGERRERERKSPLE